VSRACSAPTRARCSRRCPFRIGDTYNDEKGAAALRALFATGLFKDVRLEVEDGVVIVIVEERRHREHRFRGLKEFDKDTLVKSLKDFGIGEGPALRQGAGRSRRAGTQAPVPDAQPVRRRRW
jgi:outer membrane protein assembly factor BamA